MTRANDTKSRDGVPARDQRRDVYLLRYYDLPTIRLSESHIREMEKEVICHS